MDLDYENKSADHDASAFGMRWRALVEETFPRRAFEIEATTILNSTDVKWPHREEKIALSAVSIHRRH